VRCSFIFELIQFEGFLTKDFTSSQDQPWTILRLLTWSHHYLKDKGIPEPRLSSELLLASVLGLDRLGLFLRYDQPLTAGELGTYKKKLVRRADREPMAYIVGEKEFWSLSFAVDPAVLIPRPETELLVEEAQALIRDDRGLGTIVELGTGSGAIIVSLAKTMIQDSRPGKRLVAVDRSAAALKTAAANARRQGVERAIQFIRGDWLAPFKGRGPWMGLLVSNPPYLSASDLAGLDPGIRNYEPLEALDGGVDGLDALRVIVEQARDHLITGGWLLLEIGETQGNRVTDLARGKGFEAVQILRDLAGKDRVLKARKPL
jgi:release factor glutamine methyltransferase